MTIRDRTIWAVFIVVVIALLILAAAALAQTTGVDLDLNQIRRGAPGERFLEAEITVTGDQLGQTCDANLDRRNNESIHAKDGHAEHGTNIIIESGANSVTFTNVESEAFEEAIRSFVIDGTIRVYTQIGHDKVASMGYGLEFECNPPTTTTTIVTSTTGPTSSTTTSVTQPPPVTTTTTPPPINGIDTGGGACADGGCDGWLILGISNGTWGWIGVVWSLLAGLAWAFVHGATRRSDG